MTRIGRALGLSASLGMIYYAGHAAVAQLWGAAVVFVALAGIGTVLAWRER